MELHDDGAVALRRRLLGRGSWIGAVVCVVFIGQRTFAAGGLDLPRVPLMVCTASFLLAWLVLRAGGNARIAAAQLLVVLVGSVAVDGYLLGGATSASFPAMLVVPLLAVFFLGPRAGAALSVLPAAVVVGFAGLHLMGHAFPPPPPAAAAALMSATANVGVMSFLLAMAVTFELERLGGLARLAETSRWVEVMKDEFLATVSHELRTPLTSIRGALGLMGAGVMGELPPEALEAAQLGHRNATRLARLVDDLLDLQALRRLELPWNAERLALGPMMEAAAAESAHFASDIEVRAWPAPADLWVVADPVRIRQVLDNLISNAVKFSPPKGRVQVRALRSDTGIRIEVEDAGPGIPDALQDTLFEPFTKGDASHTSSVKGTGLGLHISQSLVHRAGGSIGHRPAAQQGTVFWFELTAAAEV